MSSKIENSEGLSKIYVPGRFDFKVVAEINKFKAEIPPVNKIEFDLSGCEYIDSAALGLLLDFRSHVSPNPVALTHCNFSVEHAINVMGFGSLFDVNPGSSE